MADNRVRKRAFESVKQNFRELETVYGINIKQQMESKWKEAWGYPALPQVAPPHEALKVCLARSDAMRVRACAAVAYFAMHEAAPLEGDLHEASATNQPPIHQ